jgi:hypothetical protein
MPAKEPAVTSDLDRIDKLHDEDIDYSDIPELGDEVFANPLAPWPPKKETINIASTPTCWVRTGGVLGRHAYHERGDVRLGAQATGASRLRAVVLLGDEPPSTPSVEVFE